MPGRRWSEPAGHPRRIGFAAHAAPGADDSLMPEDPDPLDLLARTSEELVAGGEKIVEIDRRRSAQARWEYLARQAERLGLEAESLPGSDGGVLRIRLRRRNAAPRWRIARVDAARAAEARALFERVFGYPISEKQWEWKYGAGRGHGIGAWRDGRMVAHYGGLRREILLRGRRAFASQSCDVMVEPAERGTLSRQGPLFLTATTYLEREIGPQAANTLGFGFPSERAWRVGERLGLYGGPAGRILSLSWRALRTRAVSIAELRPMGGPGVLRGIAALVRACTNSTRPLDLVRAADRAFVDRCWAAMAADLPDAIVGIRDAAWLDYRYRAHPATRYEIIGVTGGLLRRPLGVVVLRRLPESVELLDVVARPARIAELVICARRIVRRWDLPVLHAWVSENIARWFGADAAVSDPAVKVPHCAWTEGPPIAEVAGRWWLTGGDADFR